MKLNRSTLCCLFCLGFTVSHLSASTETWQKHIQAVSEEVKTNPDKIKPNQAQIDTALRTVKTSLAANDLNQAISQLNHLRALDPTAVKPILELSEKLIDALVAQSKEDITRKEKLYQHFAQDLLAAKKPSDIDLWFKKLSEEVKKDQKLNRRINPIPLWSPSSLGSPYHEGYRYFNSQSQLFSMNTTNLVHLQSQANNALQIARYWQDYLQYKSDDNSSSARSAMSSISQIVVNFTYIPRSKVLALQSELLPKNESSSLKNSREVYQIEDLEKRLGSQEQALLLNIELDRASSSQLTPVTRALKSKLENYKRACEYLEGGDVNSGFYKINQLMYHPILGALSRKTHDKFFKRYLRVPKNFTKKKNEETQEWATRYLLKLSKNKEWKSLFSALSFMEQYYRRSSNYEQTLVQEDIKAVKHLLIGHNYEASQQYMRAIVAYRQVLGTLGYCPEVTKEAGKHLLKLQKEHALEYAQSESLHSHNGTSNSFTNILMRKIIEENLKKKEQPTQNKE